MFDISTLSPSAIKILKNLCPLPEDGMLEVRKIHYADISLEAFYSAMLELDATGIVTFMKRPVPLKPPIDKLDSLKKSKFPFFIKIKKDYKGICKMLV